MTPSDESKHALEQPCPPVSDSASPDGATLTAPPWVAPPAEPSGTPSDGRNEPVSAPPDAIRGYELLAELGRGGMGVVYKARHLNTDRLVALKLLLHWQRNNKSVLKRFMAEAEAVAEIKHPNVVEIYDCGETDGYPYMSLELCPGGSLEGLLARNRAVVRSEPVTRSIAELVSRIARGVAAAHDRGIVHRDLKPANVLLQVDSGRRAAGFADDDIASFRLSVLVPKVSDFGLAKLPLSDITASQTVMGTPAYMSPEQARGEAKFVGPPADVWALGVILYESLTGERPFRGDTAYEVFARVLADHPRPLRELNSEIPEDLELICLRCLEKNPAQRYSTADELAADLGWFLRNEPISARPVEGQEPVAHAPPARAVTARSLAARAFVSRVLKARRAKRHLRRFWAEVVEEAPSKPKPQRRLWAQIARSKPLPTASHSRRTAVAVRIVLATGLFVAGIVLGTAAHRRSLQETAPDHPAATERAPVRAEGVRQTVAPPPAVPVTTPAQNPIQFHTTRPQLEP